MRIAFYHLMKTAGSTVDWAVANHLAKRRYLLQGIDGRDWTEEELLEFLDISYPLVYVHNHALNWSHEIVERYLDMGWFVFSFYRNPADQWCSFYFWSRHRQRPHNPKRIVNLMTLDEFLRSGWSSTPLQKYEKNFQRIRANLDLPKHWRDMNYVSVYSDDAFNAFLKQFFNCRRWRIKKRNQSDNRGYEYYRESGEISDETHELLLDSERYKIYQELLKAPHLNNHERFLATNQSVFQRRWFRKPKETRFVILYHEAAAMDWLSEVLRSNSQIKALHEIFETIPKREACQVAWLNNFFLKRPPRKRHLKAFGFKAHLDSILNPDEFKRFVEENGLRVVHLTRSNPVKFAMLQAQTEQNKVAEDEINEGSCNNGNVQISPSDFENYLSSFEGMGKLDQFVGSLNAPCLTINVDEICENPSKATNKVFDFLGAVRIKTEDDLSEKLAEMHAHHALENAEELRERFPELAEHFD